jgi:peptide/nickel transport system substrate-binding protein
MSGVSGGNVVNSYAPRRGLLSVVATLLAVSVLAAACGDSDDDGGGANGEGAQEQLATGRTIPEPDEVTTGGTLTYGLSADNSFGWDPTSSPWFPSATIVSHAVFDRLAVYDEDDVAQPFLAESFEHNDEFTEWTIRLRDGISFHNGDPFNAEAVRLNLEKSKSSFLTGPAVQALDEVVEVDDRTVTVNLSVSWATFPTALTSQLGAIAAPAQFESDAPAQNPIGTGPFEWQGGTPIVVTRNENYWQTDAEGRHLPYLDRIEFSVISDAASRAASLRSGTVDVIEMAEAPQLRDLYNAAASGDFQIFTNASNEGSVQFVGFNTQTEPFDDPLARELAVVAFDREFISEQLYLGLYPPARGLFPSDSPFFYEDTYPAFDPVRAQELSDEYKEKYGRPLSYTVTLPAETYYRQVGEAAQEGARAFDVQVDLELVDTASLLDKALNGNYEAAGFATFGDPNIDRIFIASETVQPIGQFSLNFTRYDDPELTAALDRARATDDLDVQIDEWRAVQDRLAENLNMLYVVRGRAAVVYQNNVFGLQQPPLPDGQVSELSTNPFFWYAWKQR